MGASSDGDDGASAARVSALALHNRPRHSRIWFSDGNIVLATSTMLFKVFQGILIHNARAFRDMFALAQCCGATDTLDGVPVVELQDDADDLARFLEAARFVS